MILSVLILIVFIISPLQTLHAPFGTHPPTSYSNSFYNPADYYYKKFREDILLPIQRPAIGIFSGNLGFFRQRKIYTKPSPIDSFERKSSEAEISSISTKSHIKPFTSFDSVKKFKQPKKHNRFSFEPNNIYSNSVFPIRYKENNQRKQKYKKPVKIIPHLYNFHYDVSDSHSGTAFDAEVKWFNGCINQLILVINMI